MKNPEGMRLLPKWTAILPIVVLPVFIFLAFRTSQHFMRAASFPTIDLNSLERTMPRWPVQPLKLGISSLSPQSTFEGQVLLLNFWAPWCEPCESEIPDLMTLQNDYGARGLKVIGINVDPTARDEAIKMWRESTDDAQGAWQREFEVETLPTTLVIDRTGKVVIKFPSYVAWQNSKAKEFIESLLAEPTSK